MWAKSTENFLERVHQFTIPHAINTCDSWEEDKIPTRMGVWKEWTPALMEDFQGVQPLPQQSLWPSGFWMCLFGQWGGTKQETEGKVEREVLNPPAFLQALGLTWLHSLPRMGAALTDISSSQSLAHLLSLF